MTRKIILAVCVFALVVFAGYQVFRPPPPMTIAADFAFADGIYVGNRVHILGVPVGTVRAVEPSAKSVRVTMELAPDTKLPASAHAYIMNPAVISDRFIELTPSYTGGKELTDSSVIPLNRTHSPLRWDALMSSMNSLATAMGPQGANRDGDLGAALHEAASMFGGRGDDFRAAIQEIAGATDVVAGNKAEITTLVDNLNQLVNTLDQHKSTIRSLSKKVSRAAETYNLEQLDLDHTIARLSKALKQVNTLVTEHGGDLSGTLSNLARVSANIANQQQTLAETLDILPLTFENFSRAITDDERMRIRLNVSTNLSQFALTKPLCERLPVPLCSGPGIINPVPIPPNLEPLLSGGR